MFSRIHKLNLAPKERDVIRLASDGLTDKQIARKLDVAAATLKTYWARIRQKLGAVNRVHAVANALSVMFREAQAEYQRRQTVGTRLLEADLLGFLVLGEGGIITDANQAFLRMIGRSPREVHQRTLTDLVGMEYCALIRSSLQDVCKSSTTSPLEVELEHRDGHRIPVLVRLACFSEQEGCVAYVLDLAEERVRLAQLT